MINVIKASSIYFVIVFSVAFVFGIVRTLFVVPRIGERWAELAEIPLLIVVIYFASRWIAKRFALSGRVLQALLAGTLAAAVLLVFEFALVAFVRGVSISQFLAERDPVAATAYYLAVLIFAIAPLFAAHQMTKD